MLKVDTKSYNFLKLIGHLSEGDLDGIKKSEELKSILAKMVHSNAGFDELTSTVKLRKLLIEYDQASN